MPSAPSSSQSRQRRPSPLNRAAILDASIALIEHEGPEALTMRRLGASLGVEGMAIYHHFAGRDELLAAIGDRLLEPLQDLDLGEDWRDGCRRFARALRDVAVEMPSTFRLLGLLPFDTPTSLRPVERLLSVLVDHGFSPGDALAIYRATVSYARGYALAEVTGFTVDAAHPEGRRRLATLPRREFPILARRVAELSDVYPNAAFELGLGALLAGLADPPPRKRARRS
jgi:AcrR family transcriptional regulator